MRLTGVLRMDSSFSLNDPLAHPLPPIAALDLAFAKAKFDAALLSMAPQMAWLLPVSFWFPARATARIVVARVQFYPADMAHAPRAGESDAMAIPLFLASTDSEWDPFAENARRADNVFDRAAGLKMPPVEASSIDESRAHEMARIGASTLETDGTILPPCHVPRSIVGRDDVFLIGAATNWLSLPQRKFFDTARYPLLVFRGRAQWAACVLPAWFWNPTAYAQRQSFTSSLVKWPLRTARRFADRLPGNVPWSPYELTA